MRDRIGEPLHLRVLLGQLLSSFLDSRFQFIVSFPQCFFCSLATGNVYRDLDHAGYLSCGILGRIAARNPSFAIGSDKLPFLRLARVEGSYSRAAGTRLFEPFNKLIAVLALHLLHREAK